MRTLEPPNRRRVGLMGFVVVVLVVVVSQTMTSVPMLFAEPVYHGQFTDSGGISKGDKVRIAGLNVGTVQDLKIDGDHIVATFSTGSITIGTESRLAIKTDTLLGKKVLEVEPRGSHRLRPGATLPLDQSTTPYQIYDAIFDITKAAEGLDIDAIKQSLNVMSQTMDQIHPHLSAALDGVAKFADTIGKRDEDVRHLLAQANQVAGVLGERSEQVDRALVNAKTLLGAFNERSQAISALLANIAAFSEQAKGFIDDNPNLNRVLDQLRTISDQLVKRKDDLAAGLVEIGQFVPSLNEAAASGPFFKSVLVNLVPGQILQPFIDAAFKKRGIDPQDFWRSAGLPAFRFPDPNGTRFPNGAPPPAPPVLEGTPDHPGPAVPPGSPCSYTPPADGLPRADNPLPCASLNVGPFGGQAFPAPVDIATSQPNPAGLAPAPGIPIAGRPGERPPDVPGIPVPLPTQAPPGARTENLPPAAGPTGASTTGGGSQN